MQMMMQMMQFAFFASPTLKNDSKLNPDYPKNQSCPAPPKPQQDRLTSRDFSVTTPQTP